MKSTLDQLPANQRGTRLPLAVSRSGPAARCSGEAGHHSHDDSEPSDHRAASAGARRVQRSPLAAQRHRAGLLFTLPVVGDRLDAAADPDRPDRLLQLHQLGRLHLAVDRPGRLLAAVREPGVRDRAREQRDPGARDPDRDRAAARHRVPDQHARPRLAVLPLGVLPADRGLVGRHRLRRAAVLRPGQAGDPAERS